MSVFPRASAPSDEESVAGSVVTVARALAAELHPGMAGVDTLGVDASIERDFWLDSLGRVELGLRIEQTLGSAVPDAVLAEAETIRDIARALVSIRGTAATAVVPIVRTAAERAAAPAPIAPATLLDALDWHAAEQPQRTHVLLGDRETEPEPITFGDLRREAVAVAAGLKHRGIRPGEAVAIMLPTGREFFAAFYGALYAQAVPVPLYPPARASQIETHLRRVAGILANCEARFMLTFSHGRRLGQLLRSLNTRLEMVATVEEIGESQVSWSTPAITPGDTAFLQYTSGSTGQPKGVVLSHANLLSNLNATQRATGATSADCFASWLPLYHDMGLIGACFGALVIGFPLVLMSPFTFLSRPARWLRAIDRHHATITAAPNFAYELCLNKIEDSELSGLNLSSLRMALNGAEAVSPQTVERFIARFAPYGLRRGALMPVYGLAESALGLTFPPAGRGPLIDRIDRERFLRSGVASIAVDTDPAPLSVVSCGAVLPGHSLRIVDERGVVLPERAQGRIEFLGPSATSGYFHNPSGTEQLFDGQWLDSGDLGYLADGELYVTGRAKDIIIRGGHNIHPQELEEAVSQLPGVRKGGVAVFPAIDRRSGTERIIVLLETRGELAAPAELIASVNHLAVDLIGLPVDEVVLAPPRTVLKTSSGKIRRAACRDAYERGELGATARAPWVQLTRLAYRALATRATLLTRHLFDVGWGLRAIVVSGFLAPWLWLAVVLAPRLTWRRRAAAAFLRLALRLCAVSLRVREPPQAPHGPQVFVANHASYVDALLLMTALPPDVAFVAKRELAASPLLGPLLRGLGCVFVERHDMQEAAAGERELEAYLRSGGSLVVFVEGTFRRDPGLLPFHMGAFSAAAAAHAVVVPVAICGTRTMLPDGAVLPHPTAIDVILGEPLSPEETGWHAAVELRSRTRQHILSLVHEPDLEQLPARPLP